MTSPMLRSLLLGFIALLQSLITHGQDKSVQLQYSHQYINEVLIDLNERHQLQISIDASLAANCEVSINQSFPSIREALAAIANICGLEVIEVNQVFIFRKKPIAAVSNKPAPSRKESRKYLFKGIIREKESGEPLPYTNIQLSNQVIASNEEGFFSFFSNEPSCRAQFFHLGYQSIDTLLEAKQEIQIHLSSVYTELGGIEITADSEQKAAIGVGDKAGAMHINDVSANLVPGNNNNLIFNNLRLLPGVTAAGESVSDYLIWGGTWGHSQVTIDGITIFSSSGLNDDIGRMNPLMVKDVRVYKGSFGASKGDRIGSLIEMEGKHGEMERFKSSINLTNSLANIYLHLPILESSTLQIAGRLRYNSRVGFTSEIEEDFQEEEDFFPSYRYKDLHLKWTTQFNNHDQLEITGIGSEDLYDRLFEGPWENTLQSIFASSSQLGLSIKYAHFGNRGGHSSFEFVLSQYKPNRNSLFLFELEDEDEDNESEEEEEGEDLDFGFEEYAWENTIVEQAISWRHHFPAFKKHQLAIGASWIVNENSLFAEESDLISLPESESRLGRLSSFVEDEWQPSPQVSATFGLKSDYIPEEVQLFLQPRASLQVLLPHRWRINAGWGIYRQFISQNRLIDFLENEDPIWQIAGADSPPTQSIHYSLGLTKELNKGSFYIEGFHKRVEGILRYFLFREESQLESGWMHSYGLDLYLKQEFDQHQLMLAYSLGQSKEAFPNVFIEPEETSFSQRHELKGAWTATYKFLSASVSQVIGSGFPNSIASLRAGQVLSYKRTDMVVQARHMLGKRMDGEFGISCLNLFNHENTRVNQSIATSSESIVNTLGIGRTFTVFLNINFF